jgi:hypothetical protein
VAHPSTPMPPISTPLSAPWRLLLLDRDPRDPKWMLATVTMPTDVRPAVLDADGRYQDWADTLRWVNGKFPGAVSLAPVTSPAAWAVDESGRSR